MIMTKIKSTFICQIDDLTRSVELEKNLRKQEMYENLRHQCSCISLEIIVSLTGKIMYNVLSNCPKCIVIAFINFRYLV